MIGTVIRLKNDMVMVFDARGEQMPVYQGQYDRVREKILNDAPPGAAFLHWPSQAAVPQIVDREGW